MRKEVKLIEMKCDCCGKAILDDKSYIQLDGVLSLCIAPAVDGKTLVADADFCSRLCLEEFLESKGV